MMNGKIDQQESAGRLRLTLRQLEVFVATAQAGSTRAGADRVARSQSAASAALVDLEQTLGVPLFDRSGRRLLLNENGRALLPRATLLLDQAAGTEHLFRGPHASTLRVAASLTIGEVLLPPLIARWKRAHPGSNVQLSIANTTGVLAAVAAFDADLGFIEGPQTHPRLLLQPWLTDELVIIAARDHPLARRRRVSRDALRAAGWALREVGSGTREAADRWLTEQLGAVRVEYELGSPEAIRRVVAEGTTLGCMSRHVVAAALDERRLVALRTDLPPASRRLAIVVHEDKRLGQAAEDFLALCAASAAG